MIRSFFVLHFLCGCLRAYADDADVQKAIFGYQLLEDFLMQKPRSELAAVGKVKISTQDGVFMVDQMQDGDAGWLRARGIQYAEHPIGNLRWQPPVPTKPNLEHPVDATTWGDDCTQGPFMSRIQSIGSSDMSESCLYLNVWAPNIKRASQRGLPVLVWFHGGAFTLGGSTGYNGDGIFSYRNDMIIVTTNYRLGALGFLGGKAIAESTFDGSSGNFGLQDTRAALQWVQRNIAAFGGDPKRVTIFGESAGASLVETHLAAPRSNGLFQHAIMQSGAFDNYTVQVDPEEIFDGFATQAGCKKGHTTSSQVLECLRNLSIWDPAGERSLMPAIANSSFRGGLSPCVDNVELTESPEKSAIARRLNNVTSVILGTNRNEGRMLMPLMMGIGGPKASREDLQAWLQYYYPGAADAIAEKYKGVGLTPWETAALIYTDSQYFCPTRRSAQWLTDVGATAFVYRLDYSPSVYVSASKFEYLSIWCKDFTPCDNMTAVNPGVGHSADVYMFWQDPRMNATDFTVGKSLLNYWMNFAASGKPSEGNAAVPAWPVYSSENTTMLLQLKPSPVQNLKQSDCDFWDHVHAGLPPSAQSAIIV